MPATPQEETAEVPGPRREIAADINRAMVVAEARLLVVQLDQYLELIGEWAAEGSDDATE
jgi:hypothetical protein